MVTGKTSYQGKSLYDNKGRLAYYDGHAWNAVKLNGNVEVIGMMKISRVINIIIALFLLILSLNILVKSIVNNTIDAITIIVSTIIIILSLTVLVYLLKYRKNRENSSDKKISSILKDGYKVQAKFLGILNYYLGRDRHYFVICSWLNPSDHKNYIFIMVN